MGQTVPNSLFDVVLVSCTTDQIQDFLRRHKEAGFSDIKITGSNKSEIVSNIRRAVDAGLIREQDVYELVRDHEESGDQHIFFFRPRNRDVQKQLNDGNRIGEGLLGKRLSDGSLPNYQTVPNEYVWADFRFTEGGGPWTAKIYGHQVRVVFKRQDVKADQVIRYYDKLEKRVVCLAHWDGRHLQIRVSRVGAGGVLSTGSDRDKREIDKRATELWNFLNPEVKLSDVKPVSFAAACRAMLHEVLDRHRHEEQDGAEAGDDDGLPFHTSSVRFRDAAFGTAEFNSHAEEEPLTGSQDRFEAIRIYLNGDGTGCRNLVVNWKPEAADGIWGSSQLRTVIGGRDLNELTIAAGVNPLTVQYVADWLHEYGSRSS